MQDEDLGHHNYFLGLEVTTISNGSYLTHATRTYNILFCVIIMDSKIVDTPFEPKTLLNSHDGKSPCVTLY